jgi:hypothetical protein
VLQLIRLGDNVPHRIVDPLLEMEIAQLLTLYREFRADTIWPGSYSNVAFLESATGERVELVHSPLFGPGYDRYFAH